MTRCLDLAVNFMNFVVTPYKGVRRSWSSWIFRRGRRGGEQEISFGVQSAVGTWLKKKERSDSYYSGVLLIISKYTILYYIL